MKFNSNGIGGGPKLNFNKYQMPNSNNLYGSFDGGKSKYEIALFFYNNGWNIRKSSFYDFEIENEWAEFEINGENNKPLLKGMIDINYFNHLIEELNLLEIKYSLELYNDKQELIKEIKT